MSALGGYQIQKSAPACTGLRLRRELPEVTLSQALTAPLGVERVGGRAETEDDDIVDAGGFTVISVDNLVYHLDEPPRGAALLPCGKQSHAKKRVVMRKAVVAGD